MPTYSPVFYRGFPNSPVRSASWRQLSFAGSYRAVPSILSTGTALASGLEAGQAMVEDRGLRTDLAAAAGALPPSSMPCA